MKPSEQEIESLLRRAPRPEPPPGLKQQLAGQMHLTSTTTAPHSVLFHQIPRAWWRRWWPAFAPAAVSVACAVVFTVQQTEIHRLKENIRSTSGPATRTTPLMTPAAYEGSTASPIDPASAEQEEIARLKERVKQLTAEIEQLEQTQKENEELRRQIAAPPTLTQEEIDALAKAKEQALSIRCINNLKQFGLAARIWMLDNNEVLPPDTLSMSNELNTPKILVCPAETNRPAARDWASFTTVNLSYDYLAPSARNADHEPTRVLSRCPIHGHVGLCDGSVHGQVARSHPEWLIERDGKLYMENDPQSGQSTRRPR